MTTTEKLFVQIFEKKNSIIEQVKQQSDLFNQHLASKLLIDGITPPSWLWNPSSHSQSSYSKELNKEELISKLLLQHQRHTAHYISGHCTAYDKPDVSGDNVGLSGGLCVDTHASNKHRDARDESVTVLDSRDNDVGYALDSVPEADFSVNSLQDDTDVRISNINTDKHQDARDDTVTVLESRDNDVGCALDGVPEADFSVNSPQDDTDVRISTIYTAPGQSLARIQRSKSRQKALELRTSAKAATKSCLRRENGTHICFSQNSFPRIDFQQADQDYGSSKLAKHSNISGKMAGLEDANEGSHSEGFSRSNYSGGITKTESSYRHPTSVAESLQGGGYSELAKEDSGKQLHSFRISDYDSEQMKMVALSGSTFGNREAREATAGKCSAKHQGSNIYCGGITRSRSSSILNRSIDESSKPGTSSDTAKAGTSTLAQSMCKSSKQHEHFDKLPEAVKPSGELIGRKTRSQSTCCDEGTLVLVNSSNVSARHVTRSRSGAIKESPLVKSINEHESYVLPNVSGCQLIPLSPSSDVNQGVAEIVAKIQLADEQVEAEPCHLRSNLDGAGLRKDSEVLVSSQPSNCFMVVQPKQLDFGDIEECNRSSNKIHTALLDEVTPYNPIESFLEVQSQMGRNVSTKPEESQTDANVVESTEDEICRFGSEIKTNDMLNIVKCNSEAALHGQNSFLLHEVDVAPSDTPYHPDKEMHLETREVSREHCSAFKLQIVEDENDNHGKGSSASMSKLSQPSFISSLFKRIENFQNCLDKKVVVPEPTGAYAGKLLSIQDRQNVLHVRNTGVCHERVLVGNGTDMEKDGASAHCSVGHQHMEDNCIGCVEQAEYQHKKSPISPMTEKNPSKVNLWPQSKRRKIDDQKLNRLSASLSCRGQMPHDLQRDNVHGLLEKSENIFDSVQELQVRVSKEGNLSQPNANKSSDSAQELTTDEFEFSPWLQIEEDEVGSEMDNITVESPSTFKDKRTGPSYLLSMTNKVAEGVTDSLVEDVETAPSTIFDASNLHLGHKVGMVNTGNLTAESKFSKRISHLTESELLSYFSGRSQHTDQNSVGPDETMPVEGFIFIDGQTEIEELDNAGGRINLSTLDLPSSNFEQGSILEQICRSASMQTPSSDFSSKFKLHKVHNLYQSVPNGLLEGVDLKSTLPLDMDAGKLLRASYGCVDEVKSSIYGVPYSDSFSYSGTRFGWNSKNQYASPVGKLWGRFSSGSSSSEKRLSSNPELTCYPIEEDPCISEENEKAEEEAEETEQGIGSRLINESANGEALSEISEACFNVQTSVSAAAKVPDRGSLASAGTEFSFHETYTRGKQKLRNRCSKKRSTNEGKENKTSLGTYSIKQGNKSLHSRYNKPKLSGNTSLRNRVQRLSQKEPKHNNIASCVTSFIPLVQQKQAAAAAACPGKRDIKVKALEAAEAAKRLEEKRANERKMKKEALKLERARIEKETSRKIQLNKKKKQEEQKKREADIAARKRLREEEETKEKEPKRKRVAEGRREQKLPEEKFRIGKVEKDKHGKMNEKMNRGKESEYPFDKKKNVENEGGDQNNLEKFYIAPASSTVLEDPDASSDRGNNGKVTTLLEKSTQRYNSEIMISRETSYDISPYQSCDDEEEEDDKPTTKLFPSWTGETLVLPLLEKLDPDVVFPLEVRSGIDEVLQPRRRRVK